MRNESLSAEYGNFPILRKAFSGRGGGEPIIAGGLKRYFVIGNFQTRHNETLGKVFNDSTGVSENDFHVVFEAFAKENALDVRYRADDMIILFGHYGIFDKLKQENGPYFSYAQTDQEQYERLIDAEEEYQHDNKHGLIKADNHLSQD